MGAAVRVDLRSFNAGLDSSLLTRPLTRCQLLLVLDMGTADQDVDKMIS